MPTGKVLWDKADGTWPMYVLGDAVLGVRTGEQRWERANSGITTAAGEVVLVRGGGTFTALSAADGHGGRRPC